MPFLARQPRQPQLPYCDPPERRRHILAARFGDLDTVRERLSIALGLEPALIGLVAAIGRAVTDPVKGPRRVGAARGMTGGPFSPT